MKNKIEIILERIYLELNKNTEPCLSMKKRSIGIALFKLLYLRYQNVEYNNQFEEEIQLLAESLILCNSPAFYFGKAGYCWFFNYLYRQNFLSQKDCEFLCTEDRGLAQSSLVLLKNNNYDFLHGATGIFYYLLYSRNEEIFQFFRRYFSLINQLIKEGDTKRVLPLYDFKTGRLNEAQVNLGLAHGIASILKFAIQCYKQNIEADSAYEVAINIIDFYIENKNRYSTKSYFPYSVDFNDPVPSNSRLAWCYGDLGIGYTLYQSGLIFNSPEAKDFAIEILTHSALRHSVEDTQIRDAGICHGSSGVAHIYNRLWNFTKLPVFREACDYWIEKTISLSCYQDGIAGFKKYDPLTSSYKNDCGLLEGVSGIGLVLLSYLTNDFSWDYYLMLN